MASDFHQFDFFILALAAFLFGTATLFRATDENSFLERLLGNLENRMGILYVAFLRAAVSAGSSCLLVGLCSRRLVR